MKDKSIVWMVVGIIFLVVLNSLLLFSWLWKKGTITEVSMKYIPYRRVSVVPTIELGPGGFGGEAPIECIAGDNKYKVGEAVPNENENVTCVCDTGGIITCSESEN